MGLGKMGFHKYSASLIPAGTSWPLPPAAGGEGGFAPLPPGPPLRREGPLNFRGEGLRPSPGPPALTGGLRPPAPPR